MKTQLPLQQNINYSDNVIIHIYTMGVHFFEEKDQQKAIPIFEFLCMVEPAIPAFRIAKALAQEGNNEVVEASNTYEKCISQFPDSFDAYLGMIRCSEKIGDSTKIKELLEAALENPVIQARAKDALEYISFATSKEV